jgi:hypothetical protein
MNQGLWIWPSEAREQARVASKISESEHLMTALKAIAKSKEGLSNPELDDALSDNSNWMTLWVVRQLTSLGFIDYKVDFFGGPARYALTDLGAETLRKLTGQAAPPKPTAPPAQPPQAAAKPATPAPTVAPPPAKPTP